MHTNKSSTRRSLLVSATALILSIAMLVGTTFAWFTDTVTSGKNTIKAGNLDVELEYSTDGSDWKTVEAATSLFKTDTLWEPNHTEYVYLKITNKGTLAFNYTLNVNPINEVGGINQDGKSFKLSDSLVFGTVAPSSTEFTFANRDAAQQAVAGTEKGLNQADLTKTGDLNAGKVAYTALVIYMPSTVGNEANYKTDTTPPQIDFGVTLLATQNDVEEDSFGSNYDELADGTPDNTDSGVLTYDYTPQVSQTGALKLNKDGSGNFDGVGTEGADAATVNGVLCYTITSNDTVPGTDTPAAKVIIPKDAIQWNAESGDRSSANVKFTVSPAEVPTYDEGSFTVATDESAKTLEIKVEGLKSGNTTVFVTEAFYAKNLSGVRLYHNSTEMTSVDSVEAVTGEDQFYYNPATGMVTLGITSCSPFTAVYKNVVAMNKDTGKTYGSLQDALDAGGEVILLRDINTPTTTYYVGTDAIVNLNGKTVSGSGYDGTFCVNNAVTLTINGDGNVIGNDDRDYGMAVWACADGATVIINGGNFTNTLTHEDDQMDMIYASDGGDIVINGGTFECVTPKWTLNIKDGNHADGTSTITVNGGKFYKYDPSNATNENPAANFCPVGKGALQDGDEWYTMVDGTFANNEDALNTALAGVAETIYLSGNINLTSNLTIRRDVTIIGKSGSTISNCPVYVAPTANVTFKNVNFATPVFDNNKASSVYASGLEGTVVFDGCTFTNPQWECIQITPKDGAEIIVTNCNFVADGNVIYAHGTKVERLLHIQNTDATGQYTAVITNNHFIGVDLCRNAVIDVDDIAAFENVTCGENTFAKHDNTPVSAMADGMIYVNINGRYSAAYVATNTYAQFTQTPAAALHH